MLEKYSKNVLNDDMTSQHEGNSWERGFYFGDGGHFVSMCKN
jgi:hypothetical protein